jgi:hypothetical protein
LKILKQPFKPTISPVKIGIVPHGIDEGHLHPRLIGIDFPWVKVKNERTAVSVHPSQKVSCQVIGKEAKEAPATAGNTKEEDFSAT